MISKKGTIATVAIICVLAAMLFSYATSDRSGDIRQDIVVGDYIDLECYDFTGETYATYATLQEIYDYILVWDEPDKEYIGHYEFDYFGEYIPCDIYFLEDWTYYAAQGSGILVRSEGMADGVEYQYLIESVPFDLTLPFSPEDIEEGMVICNYVQYEDGYQRSKYTVGAIEDDNTVLTCLSTDAERYDMSFTVISIDGDMLTMEDGSVLSKRDFLELISYDIALEEIRENTEILDEQFHSEYADLLFGKKVYDYTWIYGYYFDEESEIAIFHEGDVLLYTSRFTSSDESGIVGATIEVVGTSLVKY